MVGMLIGQDAGFFFCHLTKKRMYKAVVRIMGILFYQCVPFCSFGRDIAAACYFEFTQGGVFRRSGFSSFVNDFNAILPNSWPMNACL